MNKTFLKSYRYISINKNNILFSPGKASNAGGVATSGLEMSQNSIRMSWSRDEVDSKLKDIMIGIHNTCVEFGKEGKYTNSIGGNCKFCNAGYSSDIIEATDCERCEVGKYSSGINTIFCEDCPQGSPPSTMRRPRRPPRRGGRAR